jgi:hypothetical protein
LRLPSRYLWYPVYRLEMYSKDAGLSTNIKLDTSIKTFNRSDFCIHTVVYRVFVSLLNLIN